MVIVLCMWASGCVGSGSASADGVIEELETSRTALRQICGHDHLKGRRIDREGDYILSYISSSRDENSDRIHLYSVSHPDMECPAYILMRGQDENVDTLIEFRNISILYEMGQMTDVMSKAVASSEAKCVQRGKPCPLELSGVGIYFQDMFRNELTNGFSIIDGVIFDEYGDELK